MPDSTGVLHVLDRRMATPEQRHHAISQPFEVARGTVRATCLAEAPAEPDQHRMYSVR